MKCIDPLKLFSLKLSLGVVGSEGGLGGGGVGGGS